VNPARRISRAAPPTLSDKARRVAWKIAWIVLFRFSPTPLHAWRRLLLRAFGAKIGARAHPYPSAWVWAPWNLEMAADSCLGPGVDCYSVARVVLGEDCVVSQRVFLCAASHDYRDESFPLVTGAIEIGAGAWVAAEAFVGPGVSIGRGAVVGARAVVTRDVDAGAVVAGNPARAVSRPVAADIAPSQARKQ
jgi:putative colanic acid biosynthesis acetyltransferase WcaF